ncbi:MAG: hypothetical protein DPW18_02990 [Chloroflexi bacterium]|nr:hypothetical protein [Chloroflexota bacterium]MDL1943059.1 DUF1565 domain-containing protein [Chloroflexi bacterium CFX2]
MKYQKMYQRAGLVLTGMLLLWTTIAQTSTVKALYAYADQLTETLTAAPTDTVTETATPEPSVTPTIETITSTPEPSATPTLSPTPVDTQVTDTPVPTDVDAAQRSAVEAAVDAPGVFYVSPNGNNAGTGTQTDPWRTIQYAANVVVPGSTVIVLEGVYPERVMINRSGVSGERIVFTAQGEVVTQGFTINASFITIRGFSVTNTPNDSRNGWGIWIRGKNCIITDNYIYNATRGGILLYVSPGKEKATRNCTVRDNRLYRNGFVGIEIRGRNHRVENNEIWGTIQRHPKWTNPPSWADADGIRFHGSGHKIRGNYIHDIVYGIPENPNPHIDCFQTFSDGSYHEAARNVVIERNLCENMQAQAPMEVGKAFMIENANDLIIRNNILRAYRVLQAINSNNLQIVNNTFTNKLGMSTANSPVMITLRNTPNSLIRNNIFYDPLNQVIHFVDGVSQQGITIGRNNIYRSDGRTVRGTKYPGDLWNVNPLFVNPAAGDFHLQAGSPLINMGALLSIVTTDYDGVARPQGSSHDIGAYERAP